MVPGPYVCVCVCVLHSLFSHPYLCMCVGSLSSFLCVHVCVCWVTFHSSVCVCVCTHVCVVSLSSLWEVGAIIWENALVGVTTPQHNHERHPAWIFHRGSHRWLPLLENFFFFKKLIYLKVKERQRFSICGFGPQMLTLPAQIQDPGIPSRSPTGSRAQVREPPAPACHGVHQKEAGIGRGGGTETQALRYGMWVSKETPYPQCQGPALTSSTSSRRPHSRLLLFMQAETNAHLPWEASPNPRYKRTPVVMCASLLLRFPTACNILCKNPGAPGFSETRFKNNIDKRVFLSCCDRHWSVSFKECF